MIQIEAEIKGGLGNQMFIAATCKSLALRLNGEMCFDLGTYEGKSIRDFELSIFNIDFALKKRQENLVSPIRKFAKKRTLSGTPSDGLPVFKESSFEYDPDFEKIDSSTRLEGYFQSWKYFKDYRNEITELFSFPNENEILNGIQVKVGGKFIAVHVRRGDYLNLSTREFHGLADDRYFIEAVNLIKSRMSLPVVVFTDSSESLSQQLTSMADLVIYPEVGKHPAYYMGAMSAAKSFVMSNSTFSWWSAYLSKEVNKMVIAPRPWFAKGDVSASHLLLPDWITLGA